MKKYVDMVKDYIKKLTDDDIDYIRDRLLRRIGSDVAEVVEMLQGNPEMDWWLTQAETADDFFDMVDQVDSLVQQEAKKRFSNEQKK